MKKIVYDNNCNNDPTMPTILPEAERIIAIGDVHGDIKLVIDSNGNEENLNNDY